MRFDQQDFLRRMPEAGRDLRSRRNLWQTIHVDPWLLLPLIALTAYGLVVLYSASEDNLGIIKRQGLFLLFGYVAMFIVAQINVSVFFHWSVYLYIGSLLLLLLVWFIGVDAKGAQRWLSVFGFRFQPSELIKLVVPITIAAYLSNKSLPPAPKYLFCSLLIVIIPAVLIMNQPDLGTAMIVIIAALSIFFFSGIRWRHMGSAVGLILLGSWPMWHYVMHDYQRQRILTLFDPEADKLGAGWSITQSKTAIGSGGWEGKGWLQGTQSHLDFLPESHTDFIIAVLAEEFGFTGVIWLLVIYLVIVARGLAISFHGQNSFCRLLAASITVTFFVYVFVNIGMVSGLLPIVGVPLPLVSMGGTSVVTLMVGFGILMAISTEQRKITSRT